MIHWYVKNNITHKNISSKQNKTITWIFQSQWFEKGRSNISPRLCTKWNMEEKQLMDRHQVPWRLNLVKNDILYQLSSINAGLLQIYYHQTIPKFAMSTSKLVALGYFCKLPVFTFCEKCCTDNVKVYFQIMGHLSGGNNLLCILDHREQ